LAHVRYKTLEFSNGYAYKECRVNLENQGLVLLRGLNKDEGGFLGAGKTSVFEVFSCMQTGRTGKHQRAGDRVFADDIINKQIGKDFASSLTLDVDDHPFEIQMYRGHSRYRNLHQCIDVNAGQINLVPKEQHATDWVQKTLLHTDELSFFHTIYITQEFANILITGSEAERRNAIVNMFNLGVYDILQEKVKQELIRKAQIVSEASTLDRELEEVTTRLAQLNAEELQRSIMLYDADAVEFKRQQSKYLAEYKKVTEELERTKERAKVKADILALAETAGLSKYSIKELNNDLSAKFKHREEKITARLAEYQGLVAVAERRRILQARLRAVETARDPEVVSEELNSTKDDIRTLLAERPIAETKVEITTELNKLVKPKQSVQELRTRTAELNTEVAQHKATISSIMKQLEGGICPTCHRAYEEDVDGIALHQQLTSERAELQTDQTELRTVQTLLVTAEKYQELQIRLNDLPVVRDAAEIQLDINRLKAVEHRLSTELETTRQREKIEIALAELAQIPDGLEEQLAELEQKKKSVKSKIAAIERILELKLRVRVLTLKHTEEELTEASRDILEKLNAAMAALASANENSVRTELLLRQSEELYRRKVKLETCLGEMLTIRRDVACLEALKFCFGGNGLKLERFNEIMRDAIETTVPRYANILWPDGSVKLNLRDDGTAVKVDLVRKSGDTIEASLLSGGERHKTGLALLFGLRDLRESYLGATTNVLIVDEPFGNLDPQGTQALLKILRGLRDRFGSVFVISHRPEVFGNAVWDQTWWAVRENGFATLYTGNTIPDQYVDLAQKFLDSAQL
jgi:DNA repair exonuclease SbcCD ATPase subunit